MGPIITEPPVRHLPRRQFLQRTLVGMMLGPLTPRIFAGNTDAMADKDWAEAQTILARIRPPEFPDREFSVTLHGAKASDESDNRPALQAAIDQCNASGGGTVLVPTGTWRLDGPLHLKSHVRLHLASGCKLRFSADPAHYLPLVLTRWEGTELFNYSPLIYAYQAVDVAITGEGVIDGNGLAGFGEWRPRQAEAQKRLRDFGARGVAVHERVFGPGHWLRPSFVQFFGCTNILVEDVTLVDSPFWCLHAIACHNITVRRITVDSLRINNDGFDAESCSDVLVEDCVFRCGDDCIALKSGRDQDGWRLGRPTEHVVIRRISMEAPVAGSGLALGSEMSGCVRHVFVEDVRMGYARTAINIKGNLDRGGAVEHVRLRRISTQRADAFIQFTTAYHGYRGGQHPPVFRDFVLSDVHCAEATMPLHLVGVPAAPLENVRLSDVTVARAQKPAMIEHTRDLQLRGVCINNEAVTAPAETP